MKIEPSNITVSNPSRKHKQRARATVSQLTPELRESFGNKLTPLIKELVGTKDAWSSISVDEVVALLTKVIGSDEVARYEITPGDALMKLVSE